MNMKKLLAIIAVMTGLLVSCPAPSDNQGNPGNNPNEKTFIVFDNTQGVCTVVVYEDSRRRVEDKVTEVQSGGKSEEIEWMPGASVPFYFSYRINLTEVSDFTIDYVPREVGKDQKIARIDAGIKTTITVPKLDETVSTNDEILSNNSYIIIKNNSSFQFQLHRATTIIMPDNSSVSLINDGDTARYTITPGAVSPYQLLVGADYSAFPGSIANFEAGHVYCFVFDGTVSLVSEIEIKLKNVIGMQVGSIGTVTVSTGVSGGLTLNWPAVTGATQYDVYYGTENKIPSFPAMTVSTNTALINGLINGIQYYLWVKPKNAVSTGGASAVVSGIPRFDDSPGLYRGEEKIGSQNLAASLAWISTNAVSGNDFYIVLGANESSSPNTLNYSGKNVNVTLLGYGGEKTITLNSVGSLFIVNSGVTLTIGENITLKGRGENRNSLINISNGKLVVNAGAKITGNTITAASSSSSAGGGVSMTGDNASFTMKGGEISGNYATVTGTGYGRGGGVYVTNGHFIMNGGKIKGNNASYNGGGVYVASGGSFTIDGGEISGNTTGTFGGGVGTEGIFTMDGGKISGNTTTSGGGVYVSRSGNFIMNDGEISGNNATDSGTDSFAAGGGVFASGTITMNGGEISGNTVTADTRYFIGGGVYVSSSGPGTLIMDGGKISGNNARSGGGVYVGDSGNITINDGEISGNNANSGGGVYVANNGNLIMDGGEISGNTISSLGGGVYNNGTFTLSGGEISGNTDSSLSAYGGGVFNGGTFTMDDGKISGNSSRYGGGVSVDTDGTFTMSGGEISDNNAQLGGGVLIYEDGIFIMNNGEISDNISPNGGGVYSDGIFTMEGGLISSNTSMYGGGVLISVSGTFNMNNGEISGNKANQGGGVYSKGTFNMSGGNIFSNTASEYGGGVHMTGTDASFIKTDGGTITGYASDTAKGNAVKNGSGVAQSGKGHTVYVDSSPVKRRETTAGPTVNIDTSVSGSAGGWE